MDDPIRPEPSPPADRADATEAPLADTLRNWLDSPGSAEAERLRRDREELLRRSGLLEETLDPELQAAFDRVTEQVRALLGVPTSLLTLIADDRQIFRSRSGNAPPERDKDVASSLCRYVRDAARDLVVADVLSHPLGESVARAEAEARGAYIGTPVYLRDSTGREHPVASLCAADERPREWSRRDLDALRALADGVSTRLALMVSLAEARRERERGRARERELENFFESLPQTVIVWKWGGEVAYVSPRSRDLLGIAREHLMGSAWIERIHPDERDLVVHRATITPLAPFAERPPYRMLDDEGRYRTIISRTVATSDDEGNERFITTLTDVTNIRETELALAAERTRLRAILDGVPNAVAITDAEGRIVDGNPAAARFGWTPGTHLNDASGSIVTRLSPDGERVLTPSEMPLMRALRGEGSDGTELLRVVRPTGEIVIRVAAVPLFDPGDRVTGALVTAEDVTAQLAAEGAARRERDAAADRLNALLDAFPSAFFVTALDGRVTRANALAREIFGAGEGVDFRAHAWPEMTFINPDGSEVPLALDDYPSSRALAGESVREARVLRVKSEGGDRFVQAAGEPLRDADGRIEGAIITLQDLTPLRRANEAIEAERREGQHRIEQLLDSMPIFTGLMSPDGTLVFVNEAPLRAVGATRADVIGKVAWEAAWVADDPDAEQSLRSIIQRAASGESVEQEITFRWQGRVLEMAYYAVPIFDENGAVAAISTAAVDLSQRKAAARAASNELARLRDVLDAMTTAVKLFDAKGQLLMANAAAFRAHEATLESLRGLQMWELPWFAGGGLEDQIRAGVEKARNGEVARLPIHAGVAGDAHQYETSIVPIRDADGTIAYLLVESVDVTVARRAAIEVEAERERLRDVIEALPIGLFLFDRDWNVLQANDEGYRALGITPEQMRDRNYLRGTYIEPDGTERPMELDGTGPVPVALRGEVGPSRTMRFWRDGEPPEMHRFVTLAAAPIRDAAGNVESAVMTVVDVKPLREAQEATARERLEGAERLRRTLESLPISIGLLDPEGRVLYTNRAAGQAGGVVGTLAWEAPWVRNVPETSDILREAVRSAQGSRAFSSEARFFTEGGERELEFSIIPIADDDGELRYLLLSAVDVTERNAAQRELEATSREAQSAQISAERAKEAAERATRAKDEFLAVLSHELRTPLTPAMLGLELLAADIEIIERGRAADPETLDSIRDTFESVRQNLDLQVRLIDDLLDITRIARGKLELHLAPVDLHEAARHAIEITSVEAQQKGLSVRLDEGAASAVVLADPARMRQILWNLLANAVKFTPRGGTIVVSTSNPTPERVILTVCDSGRGIAPGQEEVIFNAFEQGGVGVTRDFGGLGLGLAISRALAVAQGATLFARSEGVDRGACFDLELSITSIAAPDPEATEEPILLAGVAPRVLLVEDNPDTARMTAELLRRGGASVEIANSVEQATTLARNGGPWHILLSDLGLPDGDGIEVLRRLRDLHGPIPAVAMSGFGTEEDRRRTREAGFRDHLVKPVTFAQVRDAIRRALV